MLDESFTIVDNVFLFKVNESCEGYLFTDQEIWESSSAALQGSASSSKSVSSTSSFPRNLRPRHVHLFSSHQQQATTINKNHPLLPHTISNHHDQQQQQVSQLSPISGPIADTDISYLGLLSSPSYLAAWTRRGEQSIGDFHPAPFPFPFPTQHQPVSGSLSEVSQAPEY